MCQPRECLHTVKYHTLTHLVESKQDSCIVISPLIGYVTLLWPNNVSNENNEKSNRLLIFNESQIWAKFNIIRTGSFRQRKESKLKIFAPIVLELKNEECRAAKSSTISNDNKPNYFLAMPQDYSMYQVAGRQHRGQISEEGNCYLENAIMKVFFKKMGNPQPLFHLLLSFQSNITIFTTNKCEKMSIQ